MSVSSKNKHCISKVQIMTDNSHKYFKMLHNFSLLSSMQFIPGRDMLCSPFSSSLVLFFLFACLLLFLNIYHDTFLFSFSLRGIMLKLFCFACGICSSHWIMSECMHFFLCAAHHSFSHCCCFHFIFFFFHRRNHLSYLNDCNSICRSLLFLPLFSVCFEFRVLIFMYMPYYICVNGVCVQTIKKKCVCSSCKKAYFACLKIVVNIVATTHSLFFRFCLCVAWNCKCGHNAYFIIILW